MKSKLKDIYRTARLTSGGSIRRQNRKNLCHIVPAVGTKLLTTIYISVKKDMEYAKIAF